MRLALVALIAACSFPDIEGEIVTRGRHVTLHAAPGLPICAATRDELDAFVELAVEYLDATPAPGIDYYLHDGNPSGCRLVGEDPVACTHYETIHTSSWVHFHEIVHTIARDWGRPPAFLLEGLAEGLGTTYPQILPADRRTAELPLESTAFFAGDAGHNYQVAGDFVVYLLRRFGPQVFHRLSTELEYLADELTIRTAFRDLTGVELASVIADWRAASTDVPHDLPLDRVPCAAATLPPIAPDAWQTEEPAECRTGQSPGGSVLRQPSDHVVDIAGAGAVVLTMTNTNHQFAWLTDCSDRDPRFDVDEDRSVQTYALGLVTPGLHAVEAVTFQEHVEIDPGPTSWSLTGIGPQSATCDAAPVFVAPASGWALVFSSDRARWPTGANGPETWLRLDLGPDDVPLSMSVTGTNTSARGCTSCDELTCTLLADTMVTAGQPLYLDLRASGASGFVYVDIHSLHSTMASRGPATTARSLVPR